MKNTYTTLALLVFAGSFLVSNNAGVATVQNQDRTGSPIGASGLCNNCHSGASFSVTIDLRIKDGFGNPVTEYEPGETYTYEVEMGSPGASAYGFQSVALLGTNANAGDIMPVSSNVKTKNIGSREYAEHNGKSTATLFDMHWTAPAAGSGKVTFYAAGIGSNANNSTSGDRFIKAIPLVLNERVTTGISQETNGKFSIYPNPVTGESLNLDVRYTGNGRTIVTDLTGKMVGSASQVFTSGMPVRVEVGDLQAGIYMLTVLDHDNKQLYSTKFIRQ